MDRTIGFWFDFSSPYSYIASEWIGSLAARHGRRVRWHAILLGVTFRAAELKSPVAHPIKREYSLRDFARSARFEGLPYLMPLAFPIPTQNAARIFWWLRDTRGAEAAESWARAGLRAVFTRGVDPSEAAALRALAVEQHLDALARQQLAARQVPGARRLAAAQRDLLEPGVELAHMLAHQAAVGLEVRRARIELGCQRRQAGSPRATCCRSAAGRS